jgi:amidase
MRRPIRRSLLLSVSVALLLGATAAAPVAFAAKPPPNGAHVAGIDIDASTIPELQALMNKHRLSAMQLTQFYLNRIRKLNPELHAVITVNPTAKAEARAADAARRHGDRRPLLGIPIIVKDNIDTTGMPTTAGSWALAGSMPPDAFIVQRLKAAGAIILGKANLSEWANFRSIPSSSGWTGIGGQTNMAYVLDRNPCGSSSGSGVAASVDLAVAAVGTETDGSIVCPSGANGIAGIKPTLGLLSRAGIVPITADQDTSGPMARNVTDAAVLLGAMTGVDPADAATAAQAGHAFTNYTPFLDPHALQGKRIGVWSEGTVFAADPNDPRIAPVQAIMDHAVEVLEAEGATVVTGADLDIGPAGLDELFVLECEFKTDVASYLQTYTAAGYPKTLADLLAFNAAHRDLEGPSAAANIPWNDEIWLEAEATDGRAGQDCQDARAALTAGAQATINDTLANLHLDAIVAPTNGPAWVTDPVNGDDFSLFIGSSSPPAVSGYPAITVPAGYVGPLPIGITFLAGRWSEPQLLGYAYDFEQATHVRVPPQLIPTIGPNTATAAPAAKVHGHVVPSRPMGWRPLQ